MLMNGKHQVQSPCYHKPSMRLDLDLDGSLLNVCLQRAGLTKLHQHTSAFRSTHPEIYIVPGGMTSWPN